ncbi:signal peptidase I [Jeotgalibacillus sp. R-1-5s-1]|uniref:signal peptidase I n=1 Tax=Jeotgalibacillus sp. R-1-5s-1 TaxID=2555897 RepID=UPI00106C7703|nr:signal peptidase I [Jeotgalibacillus sp. R-1-5s-1]TFE03517.1 signal peptidase I [Jeotgalibacillus sp. R-1-5s-1]
MRTAKNEWWEWSKILLIAIVCAAGIRYFIFSPVVVDGSSMDPALKDGDRLIVNKLNYLLEEPERFDMVVFHASESDDYIKRVIGLPGETVAFKEGKLYINDQLTEEQFLDEEAVTADFTLEELTGEETVPEGHLFVMGDNRSKSRDSRHIGPVSVESVVGVMSIVFWPPEDFKVVSKE